MLIINAQISACPIKLQNESLKMWIANMQISNVQIIYMSYQIADSFGN
jgi:hypothetical protein